MTATQKRTLLWLCIIGLVFFGIFIIPNLAGAKDPIMLSVFEQDEFAEYPFVLRMLTSDLSFYQTIRYFVIYLFYYYGYPFFFFSALAILPIKWIAGIDWMSQTQLIVLVLRQMINVLPGILSVGILVYLQTRFRSLLKSVLLFLFLLLLPPLVFNNMWWHPDGLLVFYSVLTLFFLDRDNFRFGRNFLFAAAFTGLAASTKIIGLFFFLSVGVYLIWGTVNRRISFKKAALVGILYIVVMFVTIVISNPVLLLSIERQEVFTAYKSGFSQLSQGFYEKSTGVIRWTGFLPEIWRFYGNWIFILFVVLVAVVGAVRNKNRLINVLILCWALVHIVYFTFFASVMKNYYFLPAALPLFSCLGTLFDLVPGREPAQIANGAKKRWLVNGLLIAASILILFQSSSFIRTDVELVIYQTDREKTSANIQFFRNLDRNYLSRIPVAEKLLIYRDWRAYVQPREHWIVEHDWNFANYAYIADLKPDLIIIEFENANYFSKSELVDNALDFEKAQKRFVFYSDAYHEEINGYRLLHKDSFGYAFISDEFYGKYFE
ncbi:MAG: hypothetical protein FD147_1110 [Chloroflexi bacterium]|nr:MAG: hypothetical protein FD147_1110 [Chloroflexota bacterium]